MPFIQVIEMKTKRYDEVKALGDQFRERRIAEGSPPAVRSTVTADRDRPGTYYNIVEFESYEAAMKNSDNPATTEFAKKMAALCDEPPKFYNLDVKDSWVMVGGQEQPARA